MIDEDKVLWLDIDTIVLDDLSELWNMDMDGYAIAGWREEKKNWTHVRHLMHKSEYVNSGVLLMNLKFIRDKQFDDKFIKFLNGEAWRNPDQDAVNVICDGYIKYLDVIYNYGPITPQMARRCVKNIKIYHMTWYKLWDDKTKGPEGLYDSYYREILY